MAHPTAGLSFDTNETALGDAFAEHGEIIEGNWASEFAFSDDILMFVKSDMYPSESYMWSYH